LIRILKIVVFILFFFSVKIVFSQNYSQSSDNKNFLQSLYRYEKLKEIAYPYSTKSFDTNHFPYKLDNSLNSFFPPIRNQEFWNCGQQSGVGYTFTYEINLLRDLSSKESENQYPPDFTFNFLNQGISSSIGVSYFDSWNILKQFGSPNYNDFYADFEDDFTSHTMWMSGYDKYHRSMKNRVQDFYAIDVSSEDGLNVLKHWLFNHFDSSNFGGLANFYSSTIWPSQINQLPEGTHEAGKWVITRWSSTISHAMTIVGYNDSIRFDYNNDGIFSNNIDLNGDSILDMKDWEIGGVLFANSYGASWADSGKAYFMYKLLAESLDDGGIWNNAVHILQPKTNYEPKLTLDLQLEHEQRNMIKIATGFSYNLKSDKPDEIFEFPIFNFQGGSNSMQGFNEAWSKHIEIGLDISFLLDEMEADKDLKIFTLIYEKDVDSISEGKIFAANLIDYQENKKSNFIEKSVEIINNNLTKISMPYRKNSGCIKIETIELPEAQVFEQYYFQLFAEGGNIPYSWTLDLSYEQESFQHSFPNIDGKELAFSNLISGAVFQELDFSFPFFQNSYDSVIVTTEGTIIFNLTDIIPYYNNTASSLAINKVIAPFGSNLRIIPTQGDAVWYEGNENVACFRWQMSTEINPLKTLVNFAVKLYPSGVIEFYYDEISDSDSTNSIIENHYWYSGISNGDEKHYHISDCSNICKIPENYSLRFIPPEFPNEIEMSGSGLISFMPIINNKNWNINIRVSDNNTYTKTSLNVETTNKLQVQKFVGKLEQNFPNPFAEKTSIVFTNENACFVKLEIYNISGEHIKTLLQEFKEKGVHSIEWDCTDGQNVKVSGGVYFSKLSLKNEIFVKKILHL